jgi:hypothetical protein
VFIDAENRDEFLDILKLRFAHLQPKVTLRVYGIAHASLKEYHTTSSHKKYNINYLPPDSMRMEDEEIKSAIEFERESMAHI